MSYKRTYPEEHAASTTISKRTGAWQRTVWNLAAGATLVALSSAAPAIAAQSNWRLWTSPGPSPRYGYAMAYDRARQVTVMFGGNGAGRQNDTWVWNGMRWTEVFPATRPSPRDGAMMTYDELRGVVVLFGGYDGWHLNDTWTWDGTTWTQQFPATNPRAREEGAFAYDAARGVSVLFGGWSDGGYFADTWTWNGSNWSYPTVTTRPTARSGCAMTCDRLRGQMILFGGYQYDGAPLSDTWMWDGSGWSWLHPPTSPSARHSAGMAFDEARGEVVMFGGYYATYLGDTWTWNGSAWVSPAIPSNPSPRTRVRLTYDARYGETVLFGGSNGTRLDDTWSYQVAPVIKRQPGSQVVSPGAAATLRVEAVGTQNMDYQWFEGFADDATRPVPGATLPTFVTPSLTSSTSYWVRITNIVTTVNSATASVVVSSGCAGAAISTQPAGQAIASGGTATLTVNAFGAAPLYYQWFDGYSSDSTTPILGAQASSYTTPSLTATTRYWVRVTNACGTADSATAEVTVTSAAGPVISSVTPGRARRGGSITIYGNGFAAVASGNGVYFGGRRGRVRAASATSLRVTVPRRAPRGTVDLYVVAGGAASNIVRFTVR
ncbi:MAG: IPT/TIG domain-containing protein [Acidobacteria bacterium]|nr:IPT/TIG domain-containing protein [Acidobacteriota bacterium]